MDQAKEKTILKTSKLHQDLIRRFYRRSDAQAVLEVEIIQAFVL